MIWFVRNGAGGDATAYLGGGSVDRQPNTRDEEINSPIYRLLRIAHAIYGFQDDTLGRWA